MEWLSVDERDRAQRFHFEEDRVRFVVARGMLREILGSYLSKSAANITFCLCKGGKPAIPGRPLHFNVSHSHDLLLCAITPNREVGVDVERLRSIDELEAIANQFLSARDWAMLANLPVERREREFFHCWTRMEARVKAAGVGLWSTSSSSESGWSIYDLAPARHYVGAVAIADGPIRIRCWNWPTYD
jgi:4'-phosphopantetheinyl transferase